MSSDGCICDHGPNSDGPDEFCPIDGRRCTFNPETTCAAIIDAPMGSGHCCRDYDQYEYETGRRTLRAMAPVENRNYFWDDQGKQHQSREDF